MSVKTTTNLQQFSFHNLNRRVNTSHVKKLAKSIKKIGQKVPITVTHNNVIIDGQHRYEALKLLIDAGESIRISYIKKNLKISDIAEINAHQLQWRNADWIDYYAATGNTNYQQLKETSLAYKPLSTSAIAPFLHGGDAYLTTPMLTRGDFLYEMTQEKEFILNELLALTTFNKAYAQKSVLIAVMWLMRDPNFNARRLFNKLNTNLHTVRQQSGSSNWAHHFAWWYNHGLRNGRLNTDDLPRHH